MRTAPARARCGSTLPARSSSSRRSQTLSDVLGGGSVTREFRLGEVIHALDTAAGDDRIKAIALDLDVFTGGGQSAIANVGEALDRVRRSGKRVIAYATGYGDDGYQLAAHADEIWLDPLGAVLIAGPGGANLYYAGLLERLGVTANVYRVGTYKSAVEPYTRSDMSPEARAGQPGARRRACGRPGRRMSARRGRGRRSPPMSAIRRASSRAANGDMARAARQAGLVDRIGDRTAFGKRMAELAGAGQRERAGQLPRGRLRGLGRTKIRSASRAARSACSPSPARSSTAMRRSAPPAPRRSSKISSAASSAATI